MVLGCSDVNVVESSGKSRVFVRRPEPTPGIQYSQGYLRLRSSGIGVRQHMDSTRYVMN